MINLISNQDRSFESVSLSYSNPDNIQSLNHTNLLSRGVSLRVESAESVALVTGSLRVCPTWDPLTALPGTSVTPHIQNFIMAHMNFSLGFLLENTCSGCSSPFSFSSETSKNEEEPSSSNIHSYCFRREGMLEMI